MGSQAMAQALLLAVVITASGLATFLADAHGVPAESESLYVSSDVFGGPMVLEIILRDLISDATEPVVTFDGSVLRMTQGTDGHWYAYVADTNMARIIDNATKIAGTGMDFGVECNDPGFLKGSFDNMAVVFTSGRTCDSSTDPGFMQMIRAAKSPADGATLGNNGLLDANHWPFIQTFEMSADYSMSIIRGVSDIPVRFTIDDRAALELDRESYPRNSDVHVTVRDMLLNVDPTSEDLWTFDVDGGEIYRRLFDGAGNLVDAGGKNLDPGQIYHYGGIMSGSNEIYNTMQISADLPYGNVISAVDNSLQDSTQVPTISGSLVTIRETAQNSGVFTNTDRFNAANLHIGNIDGTHKFTISYHDSQDRYAGLVASGVLGDPVSFQKAKISNPRLADASGGRIGVISVGQQILVTSTISAYVGLDQNFTYLVRIQDNDNSTIHLGWLTGRLAGGQSFEPAQSWAPLEPGTYTATVFLWESIDNPVALSTPKSIVFTVSQ